MQNKSPEQKDRSVCWKRLRTPFRSPCCLSPGSEHEATVSRICRRNHLRLTDGTARHRWGSLTGAGRQKPRAVTPRAWNIASPSLPRSEAPHMCWDTARAGEGSGHALTWCDFCWEVCDAGGARSRSSRDIPASLAFLLFLHGFCSSCGTASDAELWIIHTQSKVRDSLPSCLMDSPSRRNMAEDEGGFLQKSSWVLVVLGKNGTVKCSDFVEGEHFPNFCLLYFKCGERYLPTSLGIKMHEGSENPRN